jgi:hypothetical protein
MSYYEEQGRPLLGNEGSFAGTCERRSTCLQQRACSAMQLHKTASRAWFLREARGPRNFT